MTTSFSRLGSANVFDSAVRNLSMRQTSLSNLQENLTSGKKVVRASDDPTGAAQAERAQTRLARVATDQRALESQRNSIALAESTLGDVHDALDNIRELVVSAGNGIHTAGERKTIAMQISGLRDQVFALSNRTDTNGLPLFSALGSALAPFVGPTGTTPDYNFKGLPGQLTTSEVSIPFALDGESAFMLNEKRDSAYNLKATASTSSKLSLGGSFAVTDPKALTGSSYEIKFSPVTADPASGQTTATYTVTEIPPVSAGFPSTATVTFPTAGPMNLNVAGLPGIGAVTETGAPGPGSINLSGIPANGDTMTVVAKPQPSIFSVLDDAVRDIGAAVDSNAAKQAVSQALNNIDIGMGRVAAIRGQAGDLLNRADRITTAQEKRSVQLEGDRSRAEDQDMIQGIANFQNQQTGYQAALQSYAQVQKLSLFNFIG